MLFYVSVFSQTDSTKPAFPTITGSVDAYYRYNFANAKAPQTSEQITNNYTSFTNSQNSFELGMVSLRVIQPSQHLPAYLQQLIIFKKQ